MKEKEDLWNDNFKLYKEIDLEYHKFATHYNLSDSEFYILNSLFQANAGLSQQEIFTQWGYAKQTINSAIKSLEKKGYLEIKLDSKDKRRKIIMLTSKGKNISSNIMPILSKIERTTFGKIDSNTINDFNISLEKALREFKKHTKKIYEENKNAN